MLARNLAATHLLETTVLRSGRDLMLSVTLSRGEAGVIVWTDSVSAPDSNVAELQQRLADGIRRALLIPTAAAGDRTQSNPGTNDVMALTHYGRATILLERPDVAGNLARAEALLREATKRDPKFALAWARLGDTYWETLQEQWRQQMGVGGGQRHQHGSDAGSAAARGLDRAGEDQRGHGTARSGARAP